MQWTATRFRRLGVYLVMCWVREESRLMLRFYLEPELTICMTHDNVGLSYTVLLAGLQTQGGQWALFMSFWLWHMPSAVLDTQRVSRQSCTGDHLGCAPQTLNFFSLRDCSGKGRRTPEFELCWDSKMHCLVGDPWGVCLSILVRLPLSTTPGKESHCAYSHWLDTKNYQAGAGTKRWEVKGKWRGTCRGCHGFKGTKISGRFNELKWLSFRVNFYRH